MKPIAYILVGVPASGKSTWTQELAKTVDFQYISSDTHVECYARLHEITYTEAFDLAIKPAISSMMNDLKFALDNGLNIVWDQTSTTVASRAKKLKFLDGYRKIAVTFRTPEPEELGRRLKSRPGKNIPAHIMDSMIQGFEHPTLKEGFDELWVIPSDLVQSESNEPMKPDTQFLKHNYVQVFDKVSSGEMDYDQFIEFVNSVYQFGNAVGVYRGQLEAIARMTDIINQEITKC